MAACSRHLTRTFEAQREPEVRVVVARIDPERGLELGAGEQESAGAVVRPGERLADRPLLRLFRASKLEHDRSLVIATLGEKGETLR